MRVTHAIAVLSFSLISGSGPWSPSPVRGANAPNETATTNLQSTAQPPASPSAPGQEAGPPKDLFSAATKGDAAAVKAFLAKGVGVDSRDEKGWTPLIAAAAGGHLEVVKLLLAKGADVNAKSNKECTPLSFASENGFLEIVKTLLDAGADPNMIMGGEFTALLVAVQNNHPKVVELLLAKKADVNYRRKSNGETPLMYAAHRGHVQVMEILIANGAKMEAVSKCGPGCAGHTPLIFAAAQGRTEAVKFLLAKGADARALDGEALRAAAEEGHAEIAELLRAAKGSAAVATPKGAARAEFFRTNFSKLASARFEADEDGDACMQWLKANANVLTYSGERYRGFRFTLPEWMDGDFEWMLLPANTAAQKDFVVNPQWYITPETGHPETFEDPESEWLQPYFILQQNFPHTRDVTIQRLSQKRLKPGASYAIWLRIQKENEPDIAYAMTFKSERGHKEYGELPLESDFDSYEQKVDEAQKSGDPEKLRAALGEELGFAVGRGKIKTIKSLLARKADVNYSKGRNASPPSPLMCAAQKDGPEVLRLLLGQNPSRDQINALLAEATKCGRVGNVKMLVEMGGDLKLVDQMGYGLLYLAVMAHSAELVRFFLEKGLDVSLKFHNETAYDRAQMYKQTEICELLLKSGVRARKMDPISFLPRLDVLPRPLEPVLQRVFPADSNVKCIVALCVLRDSLWISTQEERPHGPAGDWCVGFFDGLRHLYSPSKTPKVWKYEAPTGKLTDLSGTLGIHSKVTSFCPHNDKMWMTLAEEGVCCVDQNSNQVKQYRTRDGLSSDQMFAGRLVGDQLYFGGGPPNSGQLASFAPQTSVWTQRAVGGSETTGPKPTTSLLRRKVAHITTNSWGSASNTVQPPPEVSLWFDLEGLRTNSLPLPFHNLPQSPRIGCLGSFQRYLIAETSLGDAAKSAFPQPPPPPLAILDTQNQAWVPAPTSLFAGCPRLLKPLGPTGNYYSRPALWTATSDEQGFWIGTSVGMCVYNPVTKSGKGFFSPPGLERICYDPTSSNTMLPMRKVTMQASQFYGRPVNCVRPYTRLPGLLTALAHDGEFLWIATTTCHDSLGPKQYEQRPHYLLLLHKPSQQWVGQFRIPHEATTLALSPTHVWIGLENNDESRDYGALIQVEKKGLLDTPRERWISDQIPDAEIADKLKQLPVIDQARYAYLMGEPAKVIQLLDGGDLSKCSYEALFLLGYSYDPLGVNKPDQARKCFEEIIRQNPEEMLLKAAQKGLSQIPPK